MEIFKLTLNQMLLMFALVIVGYILRKKEILPENSGIVLAKAETFVFTPALSLYNQITKCTVKTFTDNSPLMLFGFVITMLAILLSYPISKLFVRDSNKSLEKAYERNIYKYALTFANYGFVGNYLVLGVWGEDFFFKYSLFIFLLGILCSSWGLSILIPKKDGESLLATIKKTFTAPPLLALIIGMLVGLLDLSKFVPEFMLKAFESAGKCQGPVAMLLAGIIIGGYDFKRLLCNKKVYIASLLRLIVIPATMILILKVLNISDEIMILTLVAFACPLGLNTIVYPATYGGETKTGASMTIISQILSIITLPIMYYIFIVLL